MLIKTKFAIGDTVKCSIKGREAEFNVVSIELRICPPLSAEVIYRNSHPWSDASSTPYAEKELTLIQKGDNDDSLYET